MEQIYLDCTVVLQLLVELYFVGKFNGQKIKVLYYVIYLIILLPVLYLNRWGQSFNFDLLINVVVLCFIGRFLLKFSWLCAGLSTLLMIEPIWLLTGICDAFLSMISPYLGSKLSYSGIVLCFIVLPEILILSLSFICNWTICSRFTWKEQKTEAYFVFALLPFLLILLLEQYVFGTVYQNLTISEDWEIIGIPHFQIFLLQLFALCSFFSVLWSWHKLLQSFLTRNKLFAIEQQAQTQRAYVIEAKARYDSTRAMRHDIKNHFTVLKGLLAHGKIKEANKYLDKLDVLTSNLSFTYQTQNAVLDILLESKLNTAQQRNIAVECTLFVPSPCFIEDIDLCIVFSNALDNALRACDIMQEKGYIYISSVHQGDFWMVEIENSCKETGTFQEGIGLSNIRTVAEKYGGAVLAEKKTGKFRLNILFNSAQRANPQTNI